MLSFDDVEWHGLDGVVGGWRFERYSESECARRVAGEIANGLDVDRDFLVGDDHLRFLLNIFVYLLQLAHPLGGLV